MLSGAAAADVSVKYMTAVPSTNGATPGADYIAKTKLVNLAFPVGKTLQKSVVITIIGDNTPEQTEGIDVVFSSPVGASFLGGTINTGHIDILDND